MFFDVGSLLGLRGVIFLAFVVGVEQSVIGNYAMPCVSNRVWGGSIFSHLLEGICVEEMFEVVQCNALLT